MQINFLFIIGFIELIMLSINIIKSQEKLPFVLIVYKKFFPKLFKDLLNVEHENIMVLLMTIGVYTFASLIIVIYMSIPRIINFIIIWIIFVYVIKYCINFIKKLMSKKELNERKKEKEDS
jgi:hypothetical protein